jgi:hypothetical protein
LGKIKEGWGAIVKEVERRRARLPRDHFEHPGVSLISRMAQSIVIGAVALALLLLLLHHK